MIAMAPPRPSRPAAHPQPAESEQPRPAADPNGQLRHSRFRLTPGPVAASEAREHVRAVIRAWQLLVDADVAVLLASELVANAITHGQPGNGTGELVGAEPVSSVSAGAVPVNGAPAGTRSVEAGPIMLSIRCHRGELRVEVHDRSRAMPAPPPENTPAESETGRGLMLVAALAATWGFYRTPAGKAAYFTLPVHPVPPG